MDSDAGLTERYLEYVRVEKRLAQRTVELYALDLVKLKFAINTGVLSRAQACARYHISEIELRLWERAVQFAGVPGLRVTRVQIYKPIFEADAPREPRTTPFE